MAFEADVDVPAIGGSFAGATTQRGRTPGGRFTGDAIDGFVSNSLSETILWVGPNAPAGTTYLLWVNTTDSNIYGYISGVWVSLSTVGAYNWNDYVMNWSSEPTLAGSTTEGDVYLYTYDNGTAYRLVPTDGISTDGFYETFIGSVLSNLIIERGLTI
jgi:hypothetical protein